MVSLKINGIGVEVPQGSTILDAARKAGVYIPVLCHDSRLSPFGACRMCLIEQVGNPRMMTACTTPAAQNMDILTNTEKLRNIRKTLVELLLINHPLECPVCDKAGECVLQDLTYELELTNVRFDAKPANEPANHTNPFIEMDLDRCVLCGSCVRICDEVMNVQAISFINRGMETKIGTAFAQEWSCEYCGECMSVCPVGALNNRVYLFKNRTWNLKKTQSVCGLCGCGCTLMLESENNELYRIGVDPEKGTNHGFLCGKGRFGYEFVNSSKREKSSKVKSATGFENITNERAFEIIAENIKKYDKEQVAVLVSPRLTNEEAFIAGKLGQRYGGMYAIEPHGSFPQAKYADIEKSDNVIVLNLDVTDSNPILGIAIRAAARKNGAVLNVFYPSETPLKRLASGIFAGTPAELYASLDRLIKGEGKEAGVLEGLKKASSPVLVYDPYNKADLYYVSELKKQIPQLKLAAAREKANSQGVVDMGALDATVLKNKIKHGEIKALLVFGENPLLRTGWADLQLSEIEFKAVMDPFMSETACLADIYIPTATYAEKNGSFTSLEGRVQQVKKSVSKGVLTDAEIVSGIAAKLPIKLPSDIESIRKLIRSDVPIYKDVDFTGGFIDYPEALHGEFEKVEFKAEGSGEYNLFPKPQRLHSGSLTMRSPDIAKVCGSPLLDISRFDAKALGLAEGDTVVLGVSGSENNFSVHISDNMTKGCIALPENYHETAKIFGRGRYLRASLRRKV